MLSHRYPVTIQQRDLELLRGLFESRLMTLAHVAAIHFGGSFEAAKKRVQKLKAAGLLAERPRRRYQASVLHLTHAAFDLLIEQNQLHGYPSLAWQSMEKRARVSAMTLAHELSVLDVKAAFVQTLRGTKHAMKTFQTWPLLFAFRAHTRRSGVGLGRPAWVRPDGFIHLCEPNAMKDHLFYVEVDRGTETHKTLCRRVSGYQDHYRSGGMAAALGQPRDNYREFPFRVLAIFRNAERRNNAAVAMLRSQPPVRRQVWLTTIDAVLADPLGSIWVRPIDYLEATCATPFDPSIPDDPVYRRRPERETFVERTVSKLPLFCQYT